MASPHPRVPADNGGFGGLHCRGWVMKKTGHLVRLDWIGLGNFLFHARSILTVLIGALGPIAVRAQPALNYTTPYYFSTLAGTAGGPGFADGVAAGARFYRPIAITITRTGLLYVADQTNQLIRRVDSTGKVITVAGRIGHAAVQDGYGPDAMFSGPRGVAADSKGNIYVVEAGSFAVRQIRATDGLVSRFAGNPALSGRTDGNTIDARFGQLISIATDRADNIYVLDAADDHGETPPAIRKITPGGAVSTFPIAVDVGPAGGLTVDDIGNIYIADTINLVVRKVTPSGRVTTLAGKSPLDTPCTYCDADGTGDEARFNHPSGITIDHAGNVYVTDVGEGSIRKITPAGVVTTLVGSDSSSPTPQTNIYTGLTVDDNGNLYATNERHTIQRVSSNGGNLVLAGSAQVNGFADGPGSGALSSRPAGFALDRQNNVYVADSLANNIQKIGLDGS